MVISNLEKTLRHYLSQTTLQTSIDPGSTVTSLCPGGRYFKRHDIPFWQHQFFLYFTVILSLQLSKNYTHLFLDVFFGNYVQCVSIKIVTRIFFLPGLIRIILFSNMFSKLSIWGTKRAIPVTLPILQEQPEDTSRYFSRLIVHLYHFLVCSLTRLPVLIVAFRVFDISPSRKRCSENTHYIRIILPANKPKGLQLRTGLVSAAPRAAKRKVKRGTRIKEKP